MSTQTSQVPESAELTRASRAWLALKVSPVLESMAFLARGIECGQAPFGGPCPLHVVGPLVGTIVGPVAGPLPQDAAEEMPMRAAHFRGVTSEEWLEWQVIRRRAITVLDVTTLIATGHCAESMKPLRCCCSDWRTAGSARMVSDISPVPILLPDPTARRDPWHDALMELASHFRGPGTTPIMSHGPEPTLREKKELLGHLRRLADAFAGPRRVQRMVGLRRTGLLAEMPSLLHWDRWDRHCSSERAREGLMWSLLAVVPAQLPTGGVVHHQSPSLAHMGYFG